MTCLWLFMLFWLMSRCQWYLMITVIKIHKDFLYVHDRCFDGLTLFVHGGTFECTFTFPTNRGRCVWADKDQANMFRNRSAGDSFVILHQEDGDLSYLWMCALPTYLSARLFVAGGKELLWNEGFYSAAWRFELWSIVYDTASSAEQYIWFLNRIKQEAKTVKLS